MNVTVTEKHHGLCISHRWSHSRCANESTIQPQPGVASRDVSERSLVGNRGWSTDGCSSSRGEAQDHLPFTPAHVPLGTPSRAVGGAPHAQSIADGTFHDSSLGPPSLRHVFVIHEKARPSDGHVGWNRTSLHPNPGRRRLRRSTPRARGTRRSSRSSPSAAPRRR